MKILSIGRRLDYTTKRKYEIKHHRKQHYLKKYIEYFHWQIQSECFTCRSNSKQLFLLIPSSILSANPRTENWLHAPPLLFWENSYDCLLMICFFCDANTWMETGKRYTWVWNQVIHWAAITAQMVMIVGAGKHRRTDGAGQRHISLVPGHSTDTTSLQSSPSSSSPSTLTGEVSPHRKCLMAIYTFLWKQKIK